MALPDHMRLRAPGRTGSRKLASGPYRRNVATRARRTARSCRSTRQALRSRRERAVRARIARYYDPQTTQFLTRDPLSAVTRSPYGYVNGDPLNATDPTGLCGYWYDLACQTGSVANSAWNGAADVVGGAVMAVGSVTYSAGSGVANGADWAWHHKTELGLITLGVVVVAGATVLTFGVADGAIAAAIAAEGEGALGLGSVEVADHAQWAVYTALGGGRRRGIHKLFGLQCGLRV